MADQVIEKRITLKAPVSRVWRALTDSREFGEWFKVRFTEPFAVGREARGQLTHPGYEHATMAITIVEMTPETKFAFTWHPYAVDPNVDYSAETPTLVEFVLQPQGDGTLLTIRESGFDKIPPHRRDEAFRMNDHGWSAQIQNIERHVAA